MAETCRVRGPGFEIRVVATGLWRARASEGVLEVSLGFLRADAQASVAGERLAGPLLLPYEVESCPAGLAGEVEGLARTYRERVVVEQLYDLAVRMGPLASEACIDPLYAPASRARILAEALPCAEVPPGALEGLRREYASISARLASLEGGCLRLRLPSLRAEFRALAARVRAALLRANARVPMPRIPWGGCGGPRLVDDLWSLVALPEGRYAGYCGDEPLKAMARGPCRASPRFASTYICGEGGERVVVKDYIRMAVKWIPAAVLSSTAVRYRLGPRSRLAAEYKYLRLLRGVVGTPRFILVCTDIARAAAVREYVEGTPVLESRSPADWLMAGEVLGRIHEAGYALGDSNPGNILSTDKGPVLVDAEQARRYTEKAAAWDIVVALVYSTAFGVDGGLLERLLEGYEGSWGGARRVLELASAPYYWLSLGPLPAAMRARRLLRSYVARSAPV